MSGCRRNKAQSIAYRFTHIGVIVKSTGAGPDSFSGIVRCLTHQFRRIHLWGTGHLSTDSIPLLSVQNNTVASIIVSIIILSTGCDKNGALRNTLRTFRPWQDARCRNQQKWVRTLPVNWACAWSPWRNKKGISKLRTRETEHFTGSNPAEKNTETIVDYLQATV